MLINTKIFNICFFLGFAFPFLGCTQEKVNTSLFESVMDSTIHYKADTTFIYANLCSGCITGTMEYIYVLYKKNGESFFIYGAKKNDTKKFDVYTHKKAKNELVTFMFNKHESNILSILKNGLDLREKETRNDRTIYKEPLKHGTKLVYHINLASNIYENEICCDVRINQIYNKSFELWEFTSALINEKE